MRKALPLALSSLMLVGHVGGLDAQERQPDGSPDSQSAIRLGTATAVRELTLERFQSDVISGSARGIAVVFVVAPYCHQCRIALDELSDIVRETGLSVFTVDLAKDRELAERVDADEFNAIWSETALKAPTIFIFKDGKRVLVRSDPPRDFIRGMVGAPPAVPRPEATVSTTTDKDFQREVVDASKEQPVVVIFWDMPCVNCANLYSEVGVAALAGGFKYVRARIPHNEHAAEALIIKSWPTTVIFKDGQPAGTLVGSPRSSEIHAFFAKSEQNRAAGRSASASQPISVTMASGNSDVPPLMRTRPVTCAARVGGHLWWSRLVPCTSSLRS